ncbi:MAG: hypothetical protein RIF46_00545 [Cyclobacteriaceae bacterium]
MKTWIKYFLTSMFLVLFLVGMAQTTDDRDLQYFRTPGKKGINVFETSKDNSVEFTGVTTRLGGDFSMIFQGLKQSNDFAADPLIDLSNNFQLPTANLNVDVQLEDGLRMHLRTYLSSRHHTESYVKGGYIQMDKLDFISPGLFSGLMENATIRVGMDQFNYGDAHFRRSDNSMSIYNPFIGNYIMDAFSTEPFMELTYQASGFIGVAGITNGRLNQSPTSGDNGFAFFGKVGYDNQINDGLRIRLTGSLYSSSDQGTRDYIYGGDRAGGRYFVMGSEVGGADDFGGRFNPRYPYQTAIQINPFVKAGGFEFFGIYEIITNADDNPDNEGGGANLNGGFNQVAAEALYRLGANEKLYFGGRYNKISGELYDGSETSEISRVNFGGGFFMTDNVLVKLEYVKQKYEGDGWVGSKFEGAKFNGVNVEAVISF